MPKNLYYSRLLGFYGELLREKSKLTMEYYYNDDLSLSEIAINLNITKQGVRDIIKRAELQLISAEKKLHLLEKFQRLNDDLQRIINLSEQISKKDNISSVRDTAIIIKKIADKIYKENIR